MPLNSSKHSVTICVLSSQALTLSRYGWIFRLLLQLPKSLPSCRAYSYLRSFSLLPASSESGLRSRSIRQFRWTTRNVPVVPSQGQIAAWRCHICGNEFAVNDGGLCRSCGRATCDGCWEDRPAFLPTRQLQRQCKTCAANAVTRPPDAPRDPA